MTSIGACPLDTVGRISSYLGCQKYASLEEVHANQSMTDILLGSLKVLQLKKQVEIN